MANASGVASAQTSARQYSRNLLAIAGERGTMPAGLPCEPGGPAMSVAVAAPPAVAADLVLVRLALPARRPPGPAAVRKDVGRLFHGRDLSAEEFAALRDELAAAGLV